jgi:hypothetical protein
MTDLQRVRLGRIFRGYAVILAIFAVSGVLAGWSARDLRSVVIGVILWSGLVLFTPERWLWRSPLFALERSRLRREGSLPTEPASTDEVATATRRYLAALATVRAAEDAATARDAAAVALADRCERAWPANVALLELALQHAARASSVEAARSVADRALAIHGRGAAKAADGA